MSKKETDVITLARERYEQCQDAESTLRALSAKDRQFKIGDSENGYQWDAQVAANRRLKKKPCITINKTKSHVDLIVNQMLLNPPSARITNADNGQDKKSAEMMSGLVRAIEVSGNFSHAIATAYDHAVTGGLGYWYWHYDYESPESFHYQIKPCLVDDPDSVFIDSLAIGNKSDARFGFIFKDMPRKEFDQKNPECNSQGWGDEYNDWFTEETVRVAWYYWREDIDDVLVLKEDGSTFWRSSDAITQGVDERKSIRKQWHLWKLAGKHDKALEKQEWPGQYLPIVEVVGVEEIIEGKKHRKGHVRDMQDAARMYNYWTSEATTQVALQNNSPYIGSLDAFSGLEEIWDNANHDAPIRLPYNSMDSNGQPIPPPVRQQPAQMATALLQGMEVAQRELQMASGQYEANFGAKSNETSGIAINSRKQQSEVSTYHFVESLHRSVTYSTKVVVDLIQKLYDTKRVMRVLGIDGKDSQVQIDPTSGQPLMEQSDITTGDIEILFNPTLGKYDIIEDSGPSFASQQEFAQSAMSELVQRMPVLGQAAPDLVVSNYNFKGADKLAERLKKTLPPQLQDVNESGNSKDQIIAKMTQSVEQAGQKLMEIQQAYQAQQDELEAMKQEAQEADKKLLFAEVALKSKKDEIDLKTKELQLKRNQFDHEVFAASLIHNKQSENYQEGQELESAKGKPQANPTLVIDQSSEIAGSMGDLAQAVAQSVAAMSQQSADSLSQVAHVIAESHQVTLQAIESIAQQSAFQSTQNEAPKKSIIKIVSDGKGGYVGEKTEVSG